MSSKPPIPRADAKLIAETCADLADKVLYWKDRALRAEEAERKFASEIYATTPHHLDKGEG
ncbi:hypothetical protein [Sphingomonas sp. NIC1]|uniref:hypothetical protein n=1 Tax=Sphingomonas sp. NIC1 TaxID=1961362 RepID=UPI0007C0DF2C|nr:hypothetical protein [Sphingomonas sp. NIC1]ANC87297.1 hypothetical protein A7E77_10550 [Sphingomonas sp. NIC1]